jgi:hypothetical protein
LMFYVKIMLLYTNLSYEYGHNAMLWYND